MTTRQTFKEELVEYLSAEILQANNATSLNANNLTISTAVLFNNNVSFNLTDTGHRLMSLYFESHAVDITGISLNRAIIDIDRRVTGPYYISNKRPFRGTPSVTLFGSEEVLLTKLSDNIHYLLANNG
jgi:hypothetical protein